MNQTITISEPGAPKLQPMHVWIFGNLATLFIIFFCFLSAFSIEIALYLRILYGIGGIFLAIVVIAGIINYPKLRKRVITFDKNGITITNQDLHQQISWQEVTKLSMTYVFYVSPQKQISAYPYLLVTAMPETKVPTLPVLHKATPSLLFVANKSDFAAFQGNTEDYSFAINIEHFPDTDVRPLFQEVFGKEIDTTRPIMQVATPQEYNEILKKSYDQDKAISYLLPSDPERS